MHGAAYTYEVISFKKFNPRVLSPLRSAPLRDRRIHDPLAPSNGSVILPLLCTNLGIHFKLDVLQ